MGRWGTWLPPPSVSVQGATATSGGAVLFSTNFAGPNANPIGAPITSLPFADGGNVQRFNNMGFGVNAGRNEVYVTGVVAANAHYCTVTVGTLGAGGGLMACALAGIDLGNTRCAWFGIDDAGVAYLGELVGAAFTPIANVGVAHAPGDAYRLEVDVLTSTIRGYRNGVLLLGPVVTSVALGNQAGLLVRNTDCQILALAIGNI